MKEIQKVKQNSKEFTIVLLIEYSYCLTVFFCVTLIPFEKSFDIGRAMKFVFIYYAISLIPPTVFNILKIIKALRNKDYGKLSNYLIIEMLLIFLLFWIAK